MRSSRLSVYLTALALFGPLDSYALGICIETLNNTISHVRNLPPDARFDFESPFAAALLEETPLVALGTLGRRMSEPTSVGPQADVFFFRSDWKNLSSNEHVPNYAEAHNAPFPARVARYFGLFVTEADLTALRDRVFESLMLAFSRKAGRQENVEKYQNQSLTRDHRTVHFIATSGREISKELLESKPKTPWGHLQVQFSQMLKDKLNLEDLLVLNRKEGELVVEVGRMHLLPDAMIALNSRDHDLAEIKLLQKAFTWLQADVRPDRVIFQVGKAMRRHLKNVNGFSWESEAQIPGSTDYVLEVSRNHLQKLSQSLLQARLTLEFEIVLDFYRQSPNARGIMLTYVIAENERKTLKNLGVFDYSPFTFSISPSTGSLLLTEKEITALLARWAPKNEAN